jgi:iron complex outermembrane receptor protein
MNASRRAALLSRAVLLAAAIAPAAPLAEEVLTASDPAPPAAPAATAVDPAPAPPAEAPADAPAPTFGEEIVVTGTRTPRRERDATDAVTLLSRAEIERSPNKTADELLRSVPSFALFRRSSSVVADPSSQGVNLRGIGPSGVSRSLVLLDGVPANDAFGGWVYWRGIASGDVERIEVAPGGGSALYGSYALGGVTQVFSRPISSSTLEASTEYGSFNSYLTSARVTDRFGPIGAAVEAELLKSGGYAVVAPASRGPVDGNAPSQHAAVNARLEGAATPDLSFTLRGGWFRETENGGTEFTTAAVRRFEYAATARYAPAGAGTLDLTLFGHVPTFDQERARITAPSGPRSHEDLAEVQNVPAHDVGAGLRYTIAPFELAGAHTLTLGGDGRRITGALHDDLFPAASATAPARTLLGRDADGQQRLYGLYAQDVYDVSSALTVNMAVRYDRWINMDATEVDTFRDAAGKTFTAPSAMAGKSDEQVSPKLGLRVRPLEWLTLRGAAYQAFRAPTLNELYRPFQVGQVVTQANPNLGPEKLKGGEAGLEVVPLRALSTRVTAFWNELEDPIVNVTTGANLQQRQNLGQARVRGVEAEAAWKIRRSLTARAAYTYVESRVTAAHDPAQVGRDLPQDPRHRASASITFDEPRLVTAVAQVRYIGRQFEDDLNAKPMAAAALVDLSASRRVSANLDVVLAVENLFNREYLVGRAGVDTVGQPRFVHGGLRLHFGE